MAEFDPPETEKEQSLSERVREVLSQLDLHEWVAVLLLVVIIGGTWSFLSLSGEVSEGDEELIRLDERLLLALREPGDRSDPIGSARVEMLVRDVTALGGPVVLTFLSFTIGLYLWLQGNRRTAAIVFVAVVGGALFSQVLKEIIARQRPDLVPLDTYVNTYSFPSGHAMTAAITYLTLGTLLATTQSNTRLKIYLIGVALLLTVAVGVSRVYLGVHWPSDVLGGWMAGTVWALLVWLVARWLSR